MFKQGSGVVGGDASSTEETPERGRGCVVGGDESTEETSPPSRISSEGGDVLLVVMRQRKHPLRLVFRAREGVCRWW